MMPNARKTIPPHSRASGFTLIELLVVLAIMGTVLGLVLASYAGQRPARNLRITQNEMVTNLRKVQSYTLSSRDLPGGQKPQYYVLKFDTANPTQYTIQGIWNAKTTPARIQDVEVIRLPQGIRIKGPIPVVTGSATVNASCVLIAFQLPFAKIISSSSCNGSAPTVTTGDDYDKIIKFVTNNGGNVTADSLVTITVTDTTGSLSKWTVVNGITGLINFQQ